MHSLNLKNNLYIVSVRFIQKTNTTQNILKKSQNNVYKATDNTRSKGTPFVE